LIVKLSINILQNPFFGATPSREKCAQKHAFEHIFSLQYFIFT